MGWSFQAAQAMQPKLHEAAYCGSNWLITLEGVSVA